MIVFPGRYFTVIHPKSGSPVMGHSDVNSGCFITMFISRCDLYSMGSRISALTVSSSLILYLFFLSPGDAPDSTIFYPLRPLQISADFETALFIQFLRQTQILILEIFNIFLWLIFSSSLNSNKNHHFSKVSSWREKRKRIFLYYSTNQRLNYLTISEAD